MGRDEDGEKPERDGEKPEREEGDKPERDGEKPERDGEERERPAKEDMDWEDVEDEAREGMKREMRPFFDNDEDADKFADEQFDKHVKPAMDEARAEYGEDGAGRFAEDMEKEMEAQD